MNEVVILTEAERKEMEYLKASEYVKLARKVERLAYKEKQKLYTLRNLEKKGKAYAEIGLTQDNVDALMNELDEEE